MIAEQSEEHITENVINKLNVYMEKKNVSLHNLAQILGFQYFPFYRIIKNKKLPAITNLLKIAYHLEYELVDLISDVIYMDIHILDDITDLVNLKNKPLHKISVPFELYFTYKAKTIFGIKNSGTNNIKTVSLYVIDNHISIGNRFILKIEDRVESVEIINIDDTQIIVEKADHLKSKINAGEYEIIAKNLGDAILNNSQSDVFLNE